MNREKLAKSFKPVIVADLVKPGSYGQVAVFCCRRCASQLGLNSETIRYADKDPNEKGLVIPDGWSFIDGIVPESVDYYCAPCSQALRKLAYDPAAQEGRRAKPELREPR